MRQGAFFFFESMRQGALEPRPDGRSRGQQ
jgi:hypothetical protein